MIGMDRDSAEAAVPFRFMDVEPAIAAILRGVARHRSLVVFPWEMRLLWWLDRLAPALVDRVSAATAARYRAVSIRSS